MKFSFQHTKLCKNLQPHLKDRPPPTRDRVEERNSIESEGGKIVECRKRRHESELHYQQKFVCVIVQQKLDY